MIESRRLRSGGGVLVAGGIVVSLVGIVAAQQPLTPRQSVGQLARGGHIAGTAIRSTEAQTSTAALVSDEQLKDMLMGLERQFYRALRDRDEQTVRRMMGPEGIFVNSAGMPLDPQQVVDRIFKNTFDPLLEGRVLLRRLTPDVAIVNCDMKWSPSFPAYANTAVYVKRNDTWMSAYHHISKPNLEQAR